MASAEVQEALLCRSPRSFVVQGLLLEALGPATICKCGVQFFYRHSNWCMSNDPGLTVLLLITLEGEEEGF